MRKLTLSALSLSAFLALYGQEQKDYGSFTGNMESNFQYLNEDTIIGANQPPSRGLINSYMNVFYTNRGFKAGLRLESYLPSIQGYPGNFSGTGIGMRYVGYGNDFIDITLGSFYEQFGSGMALRAYEDRGLGYDSMLDGVRVIVRPYKGIAVKAVYGYQRFAFLEGQIIHGDGIVRGFDGEIHLNEALKKMNNSKFDITLGGSFVSKYQIDNNDDWVLPENVGAYGGRFNVRYGKFALDGEYIWKGQDPSQDNGYIYNNGHAAILNGTYSRKGLGVLISAKSVDNMSYRSDRTKQLQNLLINYLPALNKTHTYNLVASLYPYATQPVGETAFQAEVLYTVKRGTKLGGKYGMSLNANFSTAYRPMQHTGSINAGDSSRVTYSTGLFDMSDSLYWRDMNVNVYKKFTKKFNARLSYFNIWLNNDVATVTKETGIIKSNIFVLELGLKLKKRQSMRMEIQTLLVNRRDDQGRDVSFFASEGTPVDNGDWGTILLEYTINSHWYLSVMDQWNFGNPSVDKRAHHPYFTAGYVRGATRLTASYGRQRAGLFCVGGICRPVPASNGLTLSLTQSF